MPVMNDKDSDESKYTLKYSLLVWEASLENVVLDCPSEVAGSHQADD